MSELIIIRDHLEFLLQSGPEPRVNRECNPDYFEDELARTIRSGWILAPEIHGISEDIYQGWFEHGILRERYNAPVAPDQSPLDERRIFVNTPDGALYIQLMPWIFDYDGYEFGSTVEICNVDRLCLIKHLPRHWGLGISITPAPPGGICLGSRKGGIAVVLFCREDDDIYKQLTLMKEYLEAPRMDVILLLNVAIPDNEFELLNRKGFTIDKLDLFIGEDGLPQWELSDLEAINRRLIGTPWLIALETKIISFADRQYTLREQLYSFLMALLKQYPKLATYELLDTEVWHDYHPTRTTINKCKSDLCRTLGKPASDWIKPVTEQGYILKSPDTGKT